MEGFVSTGQEGGSKLGQSQEEVYTGNHLLVSVLFHKCIINAGYG